MKKQYFKEDNKLSNKNATSQIVRKVEIKIIVAYALLVTISQPTPLVEVFSPTKGHVSILSPGYVSSLQTSLLPHQPSTTSARPIS